jgi:hypothetical protein
MTTFEYEITTHPAATFKDVVYFCSETGVCALESVPSDQVEKIQNIFNERGSKGWELVQASFGKDGVMAFWKRAV